MPHPNGKPKWEYWKNLGQVAVKSWSAPQRVAGAVSKIEDEPEVDRPELVLA
jgi:hypothetical protein